MLILVSPAKTLDFEQPALTKEHSQSDFLTSSQELIQVCQQLTPADIASLMKVSDKIAGLNAARFGQWQPNLNLDNAKQAIFAFRGDVYTGFDADTLSETEITQTQSQLRILSGLYGLLRPLDLILPYRLEMGTSLANPKGKNLYEFWGDTLTEAVNKALVEHENDIIINLASNEYFKAIKVKKLQGQLITPAFKDCKKGEYKVISFYAKKARGLMARYIIENKLEKAEDLKSFNISGYYFDAESSLKGELVFKRDEQVA